MTSPVVQRVGAVVRDSLTPGAVGYYIIILRGELRLLRVQGSNLRELSRVAFFDESQESILAALEKVSQHPGLYGQPVSILVDNRFSYVMSTRFSESSSKRDLDEFRALAPDRVKASWIVLEGPKGKVLLCSGIDESFSKAVWDQCHHSRIMVRYLVPFGIKLLGPMIDPKFQGQCLRVVSWDNQLCSYAGLDEQGRFFAGSARLRGDSDSGESGVEPLAQSLFGAGTKVQTIVHVNPSKKHNNAKSTSSVHRLLSSAIPKQLRGVTAGVPSRVRVPLAMSTIQNSAKLLLHVLAAVCVLCLGVAGVTALLADGDSDTIDKYQLLYSTRTALETRRDSLRTEQDKLARSAKRSTDPASLISVFCQTGAPSLSLSSVTVRTLPGDSLTVETIGHTRTSGRIFEYAKSINTSISPHVLNVSSFQPEIVAGINRPDTTLRFKLGMTLHNAQ